MLGVMLLCGLEVEVDSFRTCLIEDRAGSLLATLLAALKVDMLQDEKKKLNRTQSTVMKEVKDDGTGSIGFKLALHLARNPSAVARAKAGNDVAFHHLLRSTLLSTTNSLYFICCISHLL